MIGQNSSLLRHDLFLINVEKREQKSQCDVCWNTETARHHGFNLHCKILSPIYDSLSRVDKKGNGYVYLSAKALFEVQCISASV